MVEVRQQLLGCAYEFGAGQLVLQLIQPKRRAVHRVLGVEERASVDRLDIAYPVDVEAVRGSVALAGQLALESVQPGDDVNTVYMIVRMDGIVVKVRDNGRIINKTVYLCVGLKQNGLKEVLGMWVGKSESSSFRIGVLTDLKARGVQDILITYADNLNGFTDTIRTVFPSYSLKSVWYIRSETLVNMSFIRTRKSLRQI